jgi:hypothetical protein
MPSEQNWEIAGRLQPEDSGFPGASDLAATWRRLADAAQSTQDADFARARARHWDTVPNFRGAIYARRVVVAVQPPIVEPAPVDEARVAEALAAAEHLVSPSDAAPLVEQPAAVEVTEPSPVADWTRDRMDSVFAELDDEESTADLAA